VALGDVSGKGVPAALLMAHLSAAVRFCLATAPNVAEAVSQLNSALPHGPGDDYFVTFVIGVLDLNKYTLTLANAGHMPPLRRRGRAIAPVGETTVGLPLAGIDMPYEEVVIALEPGDCFILYTDGVTEARGVAGDFYGAERFREVVAAAPDDAEAIGAALVADVRRFAGDRPQADDLTVVCFGRT
jgi:serine phosphatase RsbU (regulator of sigma subunit)